MSDVAPRASRLPGCPPGCSRSHGPRHRIQPRSRMRPPRPGGARDSDDATPRMVALKGQELPATRTSPRRRARRSGSAAPRHHLSGALLIAAAGWLTPRRPRAAQQLGASCSGGPGTTAEPPRRSRLPHEVRSRGSVPLTVGIGSVYEGHGRDVFDRWWRQSRESEGECEPPLLIALVLCLPSACGPVKHNGLAATPGGAGTRVCGSYREDERSPPLLAVADHRDRAQRPSAGD